MNEELHKHGIGGSEVAALFGLDEYQDAFTVWARKKAPQKSNGGGLTPVHLQVGKALEQGVLELYSQQTGRRIQYCDVTSRHPERPWMVYTPDALCLDEKRGVEAKVVFWGGRQDWGEEAFEIPMRVTMQCWWYMAALDYDVWDVVALVDLMPRIYTVERDRQGETAMLAYCSRWYERFIVGDERPPTGTSPESGRWLQQLYPNHKRPDIREATEDERLLLEQYVEWRLSEKYAKKERSKLEIALKDAVKDREGLQWGDGGVFTWRKTRDRKSFDWESLGQALLTQYVTDKDQRQTIDQLYTRVREGSRRIHISHPRLSEADEDGE